MMKKSAILALSLVSVLLIGCGSTENTTPTEPKQEEGTSAPTEEAVTEAVIPSGLPEMDLGGREFHFYVMGPERNPANYSVEIYAEKETGDAINDAVFRRNSALSEKYNFVITETQSRANTMGSDVQKTVLSGDDVYQVAMLNLTDAQSLVTQNMLCNLYELKYLDISKPWWDSVMASQMSMGGKLYFAMGDINIMDNNATWAVFFNKKLLSDYDMPSPYEDVRSNQWTLDRMNYYLTTVARDLDGDGTMNPESDLWGMVGEAYNAYMLYLAAGERLSDKDSDDLPVLSPITSRSSTAVEKIMTMMQDKERTINAQTYSSKYSNVFNDLIRADFKADKSLFYVAGLLTFTLLRDMESEYGMVPMPKLDSDQENFYTSLNLNNASSVTVPITNSAIDETSFVLEAMAHASVTTLTPAYYETALERKYMRDEESREMLDIILDSRIYDMVSLYNWGGMFDILTNMVTSGKNDLASAYAKKETAANKAIDKLREELLS